MRYIILEINDEYASPINFIRKGIESFKSIEEALEFIKKEEMEEVVILPYVEFAL